jgi:outer membrane protein assembly factor BamB
MNVGPGAETALVALDLNSGDILWKTDEPGGANDRGDRGDGLNPGYIGSWSTPVVTKVEGEDQIVCIMPTRVVGYEPEDGQIIWSCDGMPSPRGNLVYTSPIISSDLCVALGGFKGPALAFKMGGVGDITKSNRLWREAEKQPQRIGSGVILGDHLFTANAGPGTAQCIEVKTGKIVWENRLGGDCWGSLISVNGLLYVTDQNGTTTVFKPSTEKFDLVADNRLNEPSNATPAFSDGEIFIRTDQAIYCISEK